METMEMPMISGVTMQMSPSDETEFVTASESAAVSEIASSELPPNDSLHEPTIDTLLENAASDGEGLEEVLTKIAEGDFEDATDEEVFPAEDVVDEEFELENSSEKSDEMDERMLVLEGKADQLIEISKGMSEQLEKLPSEIQMSMKDFLEMMFAIYQMMKQEKNKSKKESFIKFLFNLVGTFMQSIADPEVLNKAANEAVKSQQAEDDESDEDYISFSDFLKKKGIMQNPSTIEGPFAQDLVA